MAFCITSRFLFNHRNITMLSFLLDTLLATILLAVHQCCTRELPQP
nr:MAG TPA: hypothetical protein [Caudoviricetes sp.]